MEVCWLLQAHLKLAGLCFDNFISMQNGTDLIWNGKLVKYE